MNWSTNANLDLGTAGSNVTKSTLVRQTGTLTASRTVTLPAANALPAGSEVIIAAGGSVTSSIKITIQRAGSDTINGATASQEIAAAYGMRRLFTDGSSAWSFDSGVLRASNNLSDLANAGTALGNLTATGSTRTVSNTAIAAATNPIVDVAGLGSQFTTNTTGSLTLTAGAVGNADISTASALANQNVFAAYGVAIATDTFNTIRFMFS
ncbi:MAG: hypothetical protein EBR82_73955, partial [Caulobacteraceae bacterium]|nr:hypothetical protein [Caulobacteraceae bacterium]